MLSMDHLESTKPQVPAGLVYLFVFQNVLNAGSPYITLAINVVLAFFALMMNRMRFRATDPKTFIVALTILFWLLLVIVYRGDFETQTLLKYFRTTVMIGVVTLLIGASSISPKTFLNALCLTLAFHVVLVLLQIPFEDLVYTTAPIFGFERETSILDQYALRKLGASSSYDTASFLSVSASVLFYLRYLSSKNLVFLLLLCTALAAGMMSSRTGMAMTLAVLTVIYIRGIFTSGPIVKFILGLGLAGMFVFAYIFVAPLIKQSLGIGELTADDATLIFNASDYGTTGTLDALSEDHLAPLKKPLLDLTIGFARDPNSTPTPSDIGYVKLIYHVGIIGTAFIVFIHLRMLALTAFSLKAKGIGIHERQLTQMLLWFIGAGLFFNYKSLELYSRGVGDLILILFIFLAAGWSTDRVFASPQNA